MRPPASVLGEHGARAAGWIAVGIAGWYVGSFLWIAFATLDYPFQLEWMEGGTVDVIQRVLAGHGMYVEPSLEYVPYVYTPLYYWVSSLAAKLVGVGLLAPRLVSFLSALASTWLVSDLVRREVRDRRLAFCGAGLFLATFALSGEWLHIARVDSLLLLLLLGGYHRLRFGTSTGSAVAGGVALALSFLTKQSGAFVAVPLLVSLAFVDRKRCISASAAFLVVAGGTVGILQSASEGWFGYFVFDLPSRHPRFTALALWRDELLSNLQIAVLGTAVALGILVRRNGAKAVVPVAFVVSMIACSWFTRMHSGSYANALIPACAALSIYMPVGIGLLAGSEWIAGVGREVRMGVHLASSVAMVLQLAVLAYNPRGSIPRAADRAGGERFLEEMARIQGEVLIPFQRFVQTRVGIASFGLDMAATDVLRAEPMDEVAANLQRKIDEAVGSERFAAIVLSRPDPESFSTLLGVHYSLKSTVFRGDEYFPVAGAPSRPNWIFVRRAK